MDEKVQVLFVEDDPNDEELTLIAFEKMGYSDQIKVAREGAEAINILLGDGSAKGKAFGTSIRLILLDLKLPKMDGLEVIEKIRNHNEIKSIPIVVLSSSSHESDVRRSYQLGVNSYVVKPVDFDVYIETVQKLGEYWFAVNEWLS